MLKSKHLLIIFCFLCPTTLVAELSATSALNTFNHAKTEQDYLTALEQFQTLHKSNPTDAELSYYLGRSLYRNGEFKAADKVLSKNIERHPGHVESYYVIGSVKLSLVGEVSIFKKVGMAKAALDAWHQAANLDPEHVEAQYGLVEFYYTAPGIAGGDEDLGQQELTKLETMSEAWANLSKATRASQAGAYTEAERLFNLAISGIPNRAFPELMLANTYLKHEKYDQALATLNSYKKRDRTWNDPGVPQIELMAAKIYTGLGRKDEAIASLDLVLTNNPIKAIREQAEEELKSLGK